MLKTFKSIAKNWTDDDQVNDFNMTVDSIVYNTDTKMLSFSTCCYYIAKGRSGLFNLSDSILLETLDGKLISKFRTNDKFSLKVDYTKVKFLLRSAAGDTIPVIEILDFNSLPIISDVDKNLGDRSTAFSLSYQVNDTDNDTLTIVEKLNGNILRTLNNAPKNENLTISITNEMLYSLPLNQENKICIEVNDSNGGISYRNYTFRRTNTPPIISGGNKDLGVIASIGEKYTVNDMEGNAVNVVEKLNNTILRSFAATLGKEYTTTIDKDTWIKLKNGQHTYSIEATDSNNSKSTRVFSFTKKETKIDFTLAKPFQTDIKASKILVTPSWELNGATAKVEVCNNAFDANPTWEDITKQVLINRHYNFTNATKTADKWGINIRIYIEKGQASSAEVSITGFGGAFE